MKTIHDVVGVLGLVLCAGAFACGTSAMDTDAGTSDAAVTDDTAAANDVVGSDAATTSDGATTTDCTGATTYAAGTACATNAFLATLTDAQRTSTVYAFTDSAARTRWSNLPGVARSGIQFSAMSAASQTAAVAVARAALSDQGFADFTGIRAADDYLGTMTTGGGGGGAMYSSLNYYVAVFGTPSDTGTWMLAIGGHHMAYNLTFQGGALAPTPNHLGVEPKAPFTIGGETYAPLQDNGAAMVAVFTALAPAELSSAYLSGQSFDDVLLGPVEYGTGSLAAVTFPSGTGRTGVLVSSLPTAQQALVTTALEAWVRDYPAEAADPLMGAYTSAAAYADTYVAWGGTLASGPDPDVAGTYLRIDGPRVWIEIACQSGVVIRGLTHFHTIYRDKAAQYGGTL